MDYKRSFRDLFRGVPKPMIGMIHLTGKTLREKIEIAKDELRIFEEEGFNGAIVEDYFGSPQDVFDVLGKIMYNADKVILGANILRCPYDAFEMTDSKHPSWRGTNFIQFDSVQTPNIEEEIYNDLRKKFPCVVLGGVGFKGIPPTGNTLEQDLIESLPRCDAIVTTGSGTGVETPLEKLKLYREKINIFEKGCPLIVGAGINVDNAYEQLMIADGAIVGTSLKQGGVTSNDIDRERVRSLMSVVREARRDWAYSL